MRGTSVRTGASGGLADVTAAGDAAPPSRGGAGGGVVVGGGVGGSMASAAAASAGLGVTTLATTRCSTAATYAAAGEGVAARDSGLR